MSSSPRCRICHDPVNDGSGLNVHQACKEEEIKARISETQRTNLYFMGAFLMIIIGLIVFY